MGPNLVRIFDRTFSPIIGGPAGSQTPGHRQLRPKMISNWHRLLPLLAETAVLFRPMDSHPLNERRSTAISNRTRSASGALRPGPLLPDTYQVLGTHRSASAASLNRIIAQIGVLCTMQLSWFQMSISTSDGKQLKEYSTEVSQDGKKITCWIPCQTGKVRHVWIQRNRPGSNCRTEVLRRNSSSNTGMWIPQPPKAGRSLCMFS